MAWSIDDNIDLVAAKTDLHHPSYTTVAPYHLPTIILLPAAG
jgi:hypothetical protein